MSDATDPLAWAAKAEEDYTAARLVLKLRKPLAFISCFHSQQCAEKYLKAFLQENDVRFRPAHPLIPLLEACVTVDAELEALREDLDSLEGHAVAVRYPGANPTLELAERALAAAARVRSFIRLKLQIDNPPAPEGDRK